MQWYNVLSWWHEIFYLYLNCNYFENDGIYILQCTQRMSSGFEVPAGTTASAVIIWDEEHNR